jgi:hypothetical protein
MPVVSELPLTRTADGNHHGTSVELATVIQSLDEAEILDLGGAMVRRSCHFRASPNIVTSWPKCHGCGKSGNGSGPGTMPSTNLSRNVSPRS